VEREYFRSSRFPLRKLLIVTDYKQPAIESEKLNLRTTELWYLTMVFFAIQKRKILERLEKEIDAERMARYDSGRA